MNEWQPIETAPKDKRILVLSEGHVRVAAYATYYNEFYRAEMTGWWDRQDWFLPKCTHWMPLPEPPVS